MNKKEKTLMQIMTRRILLLFNLLLVISLIYSFFLVRFNGYSNMQKICYHESEMLSILIDDMMYDMEAAAANYAASEDIQSLLHVSDNLPDALRIQAAFHLIEDFKPSFLTHKNFHSFCLIDRNRNSYYSFNNPGVSFLTDFENLALGGASVDGFTGFTGAYEIQSSSGRKVPFYLLSLVRDIFSSSGDDRQYLGKVIITVNIGDFLQSIQKEASYFNDTGILSSRMGELYMLSGEPAGEEEPSEGSSGSMLLQKLLHANDMMISDSGGLFYKCRSLDEDTWLILYKKNASFLQYTDAYIVGFLILMVCVSTGGLLIMLLPVIRNFSRQIGKLEQAFENVGNNRYTNQLKLTGSKEMENISVGFNQMTRKIQLHTENMVQQERKQQELKFELLVAQMNPHFIYNTLNLVIYLARKKRSEDIITVTASFISLLQNAVYFNEEGIWSTVEKEADMAGKYELIQQYRYGSRVSFRSELDESVRLLRIPRNILIPLIENALLHGICETDGGGTICVSFTKADGQLCMQVTDDGVGMSETALREVLGSVNKEMRPRRGMYSIGLSNIHERLTFLYQDAFSLQITSEPDKGTNVRILLPAGSCITSNIKDEQITKYIAQGGNENEGS